MMSSIWLCGRNIKVDGAAVINCYNTKSWSKRIVTAVLLITILVIKIPICHLLKYGLNF